MFTTRNLYCVFVLLLIFTTKSEGQRFRCIDYDNEYFYLYNSYEISGIKPDSVFVNGSDTLIWHYRTVSDMDPNFDTICGNDPIYPMWTGTLTVVNDSAQFFFNQMGDTICINTSGISDWIFYEFSNGSYFKATLGSIQVESVIGNSDSVFNFTIQFFDSLNQNSSHPFNNKEIKISKRFGFTKAFDIFRFPNNFIEYNLIDAHRYKNYEVYSYQLGDEFHWTENQTGFTERKYNDIVIGIDTINANEIQYQIKRKSRYFVFANPNNYWVTEIDTITEILYNPNDFVQDLMPQQSNLSPQIGTGYYTMQISSYCNLISMASSDHMGFLVYENPCYEFPFEYPYDVSFLIPSIGYRSRTIMDATIGLGYQYDSYLSWFNSNGNSCGTPQYIGISELDSERNFKIYPNPSNEYFSIENSNNVRMNSIYLSDYSGKLIKLFDLNSTFYDISDIANGFYLLQIDSSNGIQTQMIVINH